MRRPPELRVWFSTGTWVFGAAFALIFGSACLLFELAWMTGQKPAPFEVALRLVIVIVSGAMLIVTMYAGTFFKTEILQPVSRILGAVSSGRTSGLDLALGGRHVAEWQDLVREIKAVWESMSASSQGLEAENARRRRAVETLVAALEDTSILYLDLQKAYKDLADLKALDRLRRRFLNAVSHELRTPLTVVRGFTEFLEDEVGGPLSDRQRDFVLQIRRSTLRLEFLVNDLLDYAAVEAGTFHLRREHVDVSDQVREVTDGLSALAAERSIALELDLPETGASASADPRRISQVLSNLIHNGLKFTRAGGSVRVSLQDNGDSLVCTVRDTGIGIAPADVAMLFMSFSQLEAGRKETGTGLGLAISKSIVEAHGGEIGVESTVGSGSTFWFKIPCEDKVGK